MRIVRNTIERAAGSTAIFRWLSFAGLQPGIRIRPSRVRGLYLAACLTLCLFARPLRADDVAPVANGDKPELTLKRSLTMKTLGGRQFWNDVAYFHEYRIQKNVLTGHHRLLDGKDYRHASGTLAQCRKKLDEIRAAQQLPPMSGKAVILVHGIIRSSKSMKKLTKHLQQEGYQTFTFDYASTQIDIAEAADCLNDAIRSLEGIEEINFVVHSMGGLVVRSYAQQHADARIQRLVMIATPNSGARLADFFESNPLYGAILGPAGKQLGSDPAGFVAGLPAPSFEFAVIAGGREDDRGFNPLIPGDNDGTVSVDSTKLAGAADFAIVPARHSRLSGNETVIDYTTRFLTQGKLREQGPRHPIDKTKETRIEATTALPPAHAP